MAVDYYRVSHKNTILGKYNPLAMENESCEFLKLIQQDLAHVLFSVDLRSDNDLFRVTISQPSLVITAVGCYHTAVGYYRTNVYESTKIQKSHSRAFQNIKNY